LGGPVVAVALAYAIAAFYVLALEVMLAACGRPSRWQVMLTRISWAAAAVIGFAWISRLLPGQL
jgi:hypothetical protein